MIVKPYRGALLWLALVLSLGTAYFGAQQTHAYVVPVLRALVPGLPPTWLYGIHAALRKLAHFTEYAVLAVLWLRAFRHHARLGLNAAVGAALALCLVCAGVDEAHQAWVPGRTAAVRDVALDSLGALTALLIVVRVQQQGTAKSLEVTAPAKPVA
jgi:VanZ family protein